MKHDIEELERQIRAGNEEAARISAERIAAGTMDVSFYGAQRAFEEAILQFVLASCRAENEEGRSNYISAAGIALGSMLASATMDLSEGEVAQLVFWMIKSKNDALSGAAGRDSSAIVTEIDIPQRQEH